MIRDFIYIITGGVYELSGSSSLYLVISSNRYQATTSNAVLCPVREANPIDEDSEYHIPFMCRVGDKSVKMLIYSEQMFNVKANRLTRYKFTLMDNIVKTVLDRVKLVLFGKEVFTMEEAIVKLYKFKEIESAEVSVNGSEEEQYILDQELTTEELQTVYAREHKDELYVEDPEVPKQEIEKSGECKEKDKKRSYKYIYSKYEEFLLDYYTLERSEVLTKWNLSEEELLFRIQRCKQISRERGDDQSFWKELRKESKK